jgi:hypothetical protein
MAAYPDPLLLVAAMAASMTAIKWILVSLALLFTAIGVLAWILQRVRTVLGRSS